MRLFFLIIVLLLPLAARGEYESLEELAKAYDDAPCRDCHAAVHGDWAASRHSRSMTESLGITRDYIVSLREQWRTQVTREHLMRCMTCHAPQLAEASEEVSREVAALVVAAVDGKEEGERVEAKKRLGLLSISCTVCHNTKVVLDPNAAGPPEKGVIYGPTGKETAAHGTKRSPSLSSSLFCGQCHRLHTPPDGEIVFCSSLYESWQDAYRSGGGTRGCRDCHMGEGKGHRMPGANDPAQVREGLSLQATARAVRVNPGKWQPAAVVEVEVTNRAGHRVPDG